MSVSSTKRPNAVIFGAGKAGQSACVALRDDYNVIAFIDNDKEKHGSIILNLPVCSADDIVADDSIIFIASEYFEQISSQLHKDKSIDNSRIRAVPPRFMKSTSFDNGNEVLSLDALMALCRFFETAGFNYHIDAGTLLGLYRDGRLIPWDDDLDVAINAKDIGQLESRIDEVNQCLQDATGLIWQEEKHVTRHAFGNVPKGAIRSFKLTAQQSPETPSIDIFIKFVSEEYSDYCLASRGIRMPAKFLSNTRLVSIAERIWRMPVDTEGYLAAHYGNDWQTPDPNWSLQALDNAKVFED